jgi:uncharacterized protein (DUF1501 family)
MNTHDSPHSRHSQNPHQWDGGELGTIPAVSRRQLLQMLGLAGISATGLAACSSGANEPTATATAGKKSDTESVKKSTAQKASKNPVADRVLVVIEMKGGNDGFSTLVPYGDPAFRKLRDRIWVDPKELEVLDDRYAIAKGLAPVRDRLAFVEGVGVANPDLSHFDMMRRWWMGDSDGKMNPSTGFLGRCCDVIGGSEAITGVSVGGGSTPMLLSANAPTVSLPALNMVRDLAKAEPGEDRLRSSLRSFSALSESEAAQSSLGVGDDADRWATLARSNMGSGLDLLGNFTKVGEVPKIYPEGNEIAQQLSMVRQLVSLGVGMRVFHLPWGSFDTHSDQIGNHQNQMQQLGAGLAAFLDDLHDHGLSERVLVATVSEFGRRAEANGNGTDHGTASTMMLAGGRVKAGRYGTPVDFTKLDPEGNVKATTSLDDYYATLSQGWLGASTADVLGKRGTVIDTVFA